MNKRFKRLLIATTLFILVLVGFGYWNQTRAASKAHMTGWPYAVNTNIHDYYYDRTLYCVNEATGIKWEQKSFGADPSQHGERCAK
jgi:hypothetical protein